MEFIIETYFIPHIEGAKKAGLPELIRCKDCKFWNNNGIITKCEKHIGNGYPADWYCADGERKDGDGDGEP